MRGNSNSDETKVMGNVKKSIKQWAEEDRPREKLMDKGVAQLSNSELLAILVGSGSVDESAVELCRRILADNQNDLHQLSKRTLTELMQYRGVGEAKAITIVAALELGKRRKELATVEPPQMSSSGAIFSEFYPLLSDLPHEELWIMLLNNSLRIIRKIKISQGGIAETTVDIRLIFNAALTSLASAIVLCHNHPSGQLQPSVQDDAITREVQQATCLFRLKLIDHLIISGSTFYSYHDQGRL